MIVFAKRWARVGESWFGEDPSRSGIDVIKYRQSPLPPARRRVSEFHTILINLAQPEEAVLAGFDKITAYQVRRAGKDDLESMTLDLGQADAIASFVTFFNSFAATKGLSPVDERLLRAYQAAQALAVRVVRRSGSLDYLVAHSYVLQGGRARLLHSASLFRDAEDTEERNLVGRANRFLHWDDMLYFKLLGCGVYDFGGWYAGTTDEDKMRINRFKEGFGGVRVREYNATVPLTIRGRLYLRATAILRALKG